MRAALLLTPVLMLAACNIEADAQQSEPGPPGQRSYDLAGFNAVSLAGPHDVLVSVGPAHSVRAEGDREALDRLKIELDGRSLKIGTRNQDRSGLSNRRGKAVIHVTLPALAAASVAGSGDMRVDRVEGDRFAASIAGSGDLDVQSLRVGEAKFSIAGSGDIRAAGSADRSSVSIAGSGNADLGGIEARSASVSIVGSGDVSARAMETANVSIMGSGDVSIAGSARCSVSKMGSGNVRCGG